jgi:hypothetical protein
MLDYVFGVTLYKDIIKNEYSTAIYKEDLFVGWFLNK